MARTEAAASAATESARVSRPPRTDDGPTTGYHLHWLVIGGMLGAAGWALIGALISYAFGAGWLAALLAALAACLVAVLGVSTAIARRRVRTAAAGRFVQPVQQIRPLADS